GEDTFPAKYSKQEDTLLHVTAGDYFVFSGFIQKFCVKPEKTLLSFVRACSGFSAVFDSVRES
ncbi:MAG: hypothetical protein ACKOZV_08370, partial [Bacteroidota bacterium]